MFPENSYNLAQTFHSIKWDNEQLSFLKSTLRIMAPLTVKEECLIPL